MELCGSNASLACIGSAKENAFVTQQVLGTETGEHFMQFVSIDFAPYECVAHGMRLVNSYEVMSEGCLDRAHSLC